MQKGIETGGSKFSQLSRIFLNTKVSHHSNLYESDTNFLQESGLLESGATKARILKQWSKATFLP